MKDLRTVGRRVWAAAAIALALAGPGGAAAPPATPAEQAKRILDAAGFKGGLVVHVGCGDGRLTAALRAGKSTIVHGLDADATNVAAARTRARSLGLCGKVAAEQLLGNQLPYADNLANLVVAEHLGKVPMAEVMRVLAPHGVAQVKSGGTWKTTLKPWPKEIDEWTHFLHDASNNAVAHDTLVGPPRRLQWIGGPLWARSHEYDASLSAMVSARGRLFYILDEGPTGIIDKRIPDEWSLIARDAFSGVVLWKRPIADWGWKAWKRSAMGRADWRRMRSQRHRVPLSAPRRLVAAGDRVYVTLGYRAAVTALDAATGRTITTYAATERTDEIVHRDGRLVLCIRTAGKPAGPAGPARRRKGRTAQQTGHAVIVAIKADTGERLWQTKPGAVVPLSLAAAGAHVLYHDGGAVVCLDAASGRRRWRTPAGGAANSVWNTDMTLVAYRGVVLCASRKQLTGLSMTRGKVLWKLSGARGYGYGVANPPDLFVADSLVWYGQGRPELQSITGYDPLRGKPVRTVPMGGVITRGHHARCYRSKATDRYLLLPKRAVEFIDVKGGRHARHNWVRGGCRYGVLPCNGLLYSTPHPCFCYAGVKLGGFLALSARGPTTRETASGRRLQKGPAYGQIVNRQSSIVNPDDWPMYRHDPKRSGSTSSVVSPRLRPVWTARLAGKLSQPVVVGRRLFVVRTNAGQVCCLDAATGKPIWDYLAGGRIDSAPTCYKGRLIFGSADGSVYCLRASDGELAWRFRAAPGERRVVAFGQVESAWPVHGSVLVMNGMVYFAAGRSSFLDGGIVLYGLDPATGRKRYEARLAGPEADVKKLDEMAYGMEGAKSDILVTDGKLIYLFHNAFNDRLEKQPTPVRGKPSVRNLAVRDFGRHLFSNAGFLDTSGFNRNYWMYGDRWGGFNFANQSPQAGQLVVFDEACTYAVKTFVRRNMLSPQFFPATDGYYLVADSNDTRPVLVDGNHKPDYMRWLPQEGKPQVCWNLGVGFARSKPAKWVNILPVRIRAMVRTGNVLFAAGEPDLCDPDDPTGALAGRKGAVLMALNPEDGKKLFECRLAAAPVFDGLVAAGGRLYVTCLDGRTLCLGEAK